MFRKGALSLAAALAVVVALAAACVWVTVRRADASLAERRREVAQMDPAEKHRLQQAQKQFLALDPQQQEQLRQLHRQIESSPNKEQLRQVIDRYCGWLETLSAYERLELRRLEPEERFWAVKQKLKRQREIQARMAEGRRRMFAEMAKRMLPSQIAAEDLEGIQDWMKRFAGRDAQALLRYVPEDRRDDVTKVLQRTEGDLRGRLYLLGWLWLRWQLDHPEDPLPLESDDMNSLVGSLTEPSRQKLAGLPEKAQKEILAAAIRFLVFSNMMSRSWRQAPPVFDERELAALLDQHITPEQRDELWRMSPRERQRRLWFEFLRAKMPELAHGPPGGPPIGFWPGFGRPQRKGPRGGFRPGAREDRSPPDGPHKPPFPPRGGRRPDQPGRFGPPHKRPDNSPPQHPSGSSSGRSGSKERSE